MNLEESRRRAEEAGTQNILEVRQTVRRVIYGINAVVAALMILYWSYSNAGSAHHEAQERFMHTRPVQQTQWKPDPMARCDQRVQRVTVGAEDHTFNPPGATICYARWFRRSAEGCLEVRDNFGTVLKNDCTNREDLAGQSPARFRAKGAGTVVVDYVLCKEDDPTRQYVVADGCPIPTQRTAGR